MAGSISSWATYSLGGTDIGPNGADANVAAETFAAVIAIEFGVDDLMDGTRHSSATVKIPARNIRHEFSHPR